MCEPFTTVPDQGEVMNRTVGVRGLPHLAPGSCKSQGVWTMAVISDAPPCDNGLCLFPLVLFRTNQFRIPYRFYVMLQNLNIEKFPKYSSSSCYLFEPHTFFVNRIHRHQEGSGLPLDPNVCSSCCYRCLPYHPS